MVLTENAVVLKNYGKNIVFFIHSLEFALFYLKFFVKFLL